ncbi:hypothetical protein BDQ12DRAFT_684066 [Crucibulum laeve]|uniref:NADH:flavin oxidoreductase/NADH oxidase N-terminal domain-containing protein n=1 Tax=Crucibulum laeve TaxID=68775 RepID=A0A5C3MAI2_9AGAR|nr:hypothetical protein BDQ12DRAFT_684066 [Crucibulum laeve]
MSALACDRAPGTVPNDVMDEYYVQRAIGGAGLIISERILTTQQGTEWPHASRIWNSEQVSAWEKITDDVHAAGSHIYAQLWHVGRVSYPDAPEQKLAGVPAYTLTAISVRGGKFRHVHGLPGYVTPTAIDDPWTIIKQFKEATGNAKKTGFDANGYLITQFLDINSNQRTDQFSRHWLKSLVKMFAVMLSPAGGYNDADKLNLAHITLYVEFEGKKRAAIHDIVESYRHLIKNAKVFVNAGVTPEESTRLISDGKADAISIGFSWTTHPDLVKRTQHGKPLNNIPDIPHLQWGKSEKDLRAGYTDYPEAEY